MNKTYVYDIDSIIKRGDILDEKKNKIHEDFINSYPNNTSTYPSSQNSKTFNSQRNKLNNFEKELLTDKIFDFPNNEDFLCSDDFKTITRWKCVGSETKVGFKLLKTIKYEGMIEFSYKINNSDNCNFFIGVCEEETDLSNGASNTNTSWMCYMLDGRFINSGDQKAKFSDKWERPDDRIFTICIDTSTDEMYIKCQDNQSFLYSHKLKMNILDSQKNKLVGCVDIKKVGDSISVF